MSLVSLAQTWQVLPHARARWGAVSSRALSPAPSLSVVPESAPAHGSRPLLRPLEQCRDRRLCQSGRASGGPTVTNIRSLRIFCCGVASMTRPLPRGATRGSSSCHLRVSGRPSRHCKCMRACSRGHAAASRRLPLATQSEADRARRRHSARCCPAPSACRRVHADAHRFIFAAPK
jgi:hypothetical protein